MKFEKKVTWHNHFVYQRKWSEKGAKSLQMWALLKCPLDGRGQDHTQTQHRLIGINC